MSKYETARVARVKPEHAPDGSRVRPLLALSAGSMAHFELDPGAISRAVRHRSVGEIWLVIAGYGRMWRQQSERQSIVDLTPGVCVSIPAGTAFQFRCEGNEALHIAAVTMPPWPGDEEAELVTGKW